LSYSSPRELPVIEVARRHQPQPLRFLLIRPVRYLDEMSHHALISSTSVPVDGSWPTDLQNPDRPHTLPRDLGVERALEGRCFEQQPFRNGSRGRHALGRGAGKAVAGEASLGALKINCRRKSLVMRRVDIGRE
jgi:hypothetical protein